MTSHGHSSILFTRKVLPIKVCPIAVAARTNALVTEGGAHEGGMTKTISLLIAPALGRPGGNGRKMTGTSPAPAARRSDHKLNEVESILRDDTLLVSATVETWTALRAAAFAAAEAAARARSVAALLDEGLAELQDGQTPPGQALAAWQRCPRGPDRLSAREREVLALVAEGRTNKAIAEALYVSPNTVKTHVASLLNKLHAETRVQLAAIAAEQRLHHRAAVLGDQFGSPSKARTSPDSMPMELECA